jgi:tetratricopeptide (TPR) repeat protein
MRARTPWLVAGGIVAAFVAVLIIPQTRSALFVALFTDEVMRRCDSQDPKIAIPGCTEVVESGRYETVRNAALYRRAGFYSNAGQHDLAVKDLEELLGQVPDDSEARMLLAREYSEVGDDDRAIAQYDEVIKREPKDGFAYMFRSGLKEKKGDLAGAAADRASAEQFPPVPVPE